MDMISKSYKYDKINNENKLIESIENDIRSEFIYDGIGRPLLTRFFFIDDQSPVSEINYEYDDELYYQKITKSMLEISDHRKILESLTNTSVSNNINRDFLDTIIYDGSEKIIQCNNGLKLNTDKLINFFIELIKNNCNNNEILKNITVDNISRSIELDKNNINIELVSEYNENHVLTIYNETINYNRLIIQFKIEQNKIKSSIYEYIDYNKEELKTSKCKIIYKGEIIESYSIESYKDAINDDDERIYKYKDSSKENYETRYHCNNILSKFFYNINKHNLNQLIEYINTAISVDITKQQIVKNEDSVFLGSAILRNRMSIITTDKPDIEITRMRTSNKKFIRINIIVKNNDNYTTTIILDKEGKIRYTMTSVDIKGKGLKLKVRKRSSSIASYNNNHSIICNNSGEVMEEYTDNNDNTLLFIQYMVPKSLFDFKVQEFEDELGETLF